MLSIVGSPFLGFFFVIFIPCDIVSHLDKTSKSFAPCTKSDARHLPGVMIRYQETICDYKSSFFFFFFFFFFTEKVFWW